MELVGERDRVAELVRAGLPMPVLDRLARLAARELRTPVALVSLVTSERQLYVGAQGLPPPLDEQRETPLSHAICRLVVEDRAPIVVGDTRDEPRLRDHPAVRDHGIRAYAGMPVQHSGEVLGAFCALDQEPRRWSAHDLDVLRDLAATAEAEIAVRVANLDLARAHEQLADERAFLAAVLDSLDIGVAALDAQGRLVMANRSLQRLYGALPGPVDFADWAPDLEIFDEDGLSRVRRDDVPIARALRGEHVDGTELVLRRGGTARRVVSHGRPIVRADGRRIGAVGTSEDVTTRRRAEALTQALAAAAVALNDFRPPEEGLAATLGAVCRALTWQAGHCWLRDDRGALRRTTVWPPYLGEPAEGAAQLAEGAADENRPVWRPAVATRPGALMVPVRSGQEVLAVLGFESADLAMPEDEVLSALEGVAAHVGRHLERRRAEQLGAQLERQRDQFQQAIAQVKDYVWTVRLGPGDQVTSVYSSPQGARSFAVDVAPGDDALRRVLAAVHPDDLPAFSEFYDTVVTQDRAGEAEVRITGDDGVTRWAWLRAAPRREGEQRYVDGVATDVSERRALVERLERSLDQEHRAVQRLEKLDRMRNELVAAVNHELKTPLTVIHGYAQLLAEGDVPEAERQMAAIIERRSIEMQRIVSDLLDLAQLDAGVAVGELQPVAADELVAEVVQEHRLTAERAGLRLALDARTGAQVRADASRLRQALDNLVSNAVKFTPAGGGVRVTSRTAGGQWVAEVADTGIGIPEGEVAKVFDRFVRATSALVHDIAGTGLGLPLAREIIEAHGGTVALTSTVGQGTTVRLTLPLC